MLSAVKRVFIDRSGLNKTEVERPRSEDIARIKVQLPIKSGICSHRNYDKLKGIDYSRFGIELEEPKAEDIEDDNNLAWAILPLGWSVQKELNDDDFDFFIILDSDGIPKIRIMLKNESFEESFYVLEISKDNAKVLKKEIANRQKFQTLLKKYNAILEIVRDSKLPEVSKLAELELKKARKDLSAFTKKHTEFNSKLPSK